MPPIQEHTKIISTLVKKPPAEKPFTKISPIGRITEKIIIPQSSPVFMPSLPRLFAAVKPAAKHPAHKAMLDINVNVPSDRSMTDASPENSTDVRKTAPTQASTEYAIVSNLFFLRLSSAVLRRMAILLSGTAAYTRIAVSPTNIYAPNK